MYKIAGVSAVTCAIFAQVFAQTGLDPQSTLSPKLYNQISGASIPDALNKLDSEMQVIHAQHIYLLDQQKVILDQMKQMLEIRKEVILNVDRLAALDVRFSKHEEKESTNPATLAVLGARVDEIYKIGVWLLAGIGTMLMSGAGFLIKKILWTHNTPRGLQRRETD